MSPAFHVPGFLMPDWPEPWQECYAAFLQSIYDISGSEKSRVAYRSNLARFYSLCNKLPDAVSRTDVLKFIQSPSTSPRNPGAEVTASTKNIRLCVLVSFYRFASGYGENGAPLFHAAMPTAGFRYLKREVHYRAMSATELERFFAVIPTDTVLGLRDRALYLLYFWSGRRRMEINRLRWCDIEPAMIEDDDGSRRPGYIYRYTGKGKSRQVKAKELPQPAWQALHTYLERSGRLATIQPGDPLFPSTYAGRRDSPLNAGHLNARFKRYCAKAGLDAKNLSLHSLRHTAAHERYMAGEKITSIKEYLDHENLQTTYFYVLSLSGVADNGAKLLEKRFGHLSR